ncbi:MAG: hypothetical protein JWL90_1887 [Chthoniobacteraceae bacterium]|nr:hypothetical protein [Chthoniobacteraceae bacterium]
MIKGSEKMDSLIESFRVSVYFFLEFTCLNFMPDPVKQGLPRHRDANPPINYTGLNSAVQPKVRNRVKTRQDDKPRNFAKE